MIHQINPAYQIDLELYWLPLTLPLGLCCLILSLKLTKFLTKTQASLAKSMLVKAYRQLEILHYVLLEVEQSKDTFPALRYITRDHGSNFRYWYKAVHQVGVKLNTYFPYTLAGLQQRRTPISTAYLTVLNLPWVKTWLRLKKSSKKQYLQNLKSMCITD